MKANIDAYLAPALTGSRADQFEAAGKRMDEKLIVGRFFMERMLPAATTHLQRIKAGAVSTMALPVEAF